MILPNEVKRKSIQNSKLDTLEVKIDDALRYDSSKDRVHCDLALNCLTTYRINTLFKYIDAGYDVMISNESDKNGVTLTVYHYFDKE